MSGKYALIIGNTEYTDPGLAQLTAPGKDAEDFARVLKDTEIGAFDDVVTLLNQPEYVVREAIDDFFNLKLPNDLLVLYFSGHGVRDELGALYLAVKNTVRSKLRATGIKSGYIREAMDQSRSKRQVLILDCCNSGAFFHGTKAAIGVSIGTATAFEGGFGRVILTASDSTQFAWEGDKVIGDTDNSLFTHFLIEGFKGEADFDGDGRITVDDLYDYAYEKVRLATPRQTPSKFTSKQQGELVLRDNIPANNRFREQPDEKPFRAGADYSHTKRNVQPSKIQGEKFFKIWWSTLTKPTEANYDRLIEDPNISQKKAYSWVLLAGLIFTNILVFSRFSPLVLFEIAHPGTIYGAIYEPIEFTPAEAQWLVELGKADRRKATVTALQLIRDKVQFNIELAINMAKQRQNIRSAITSEDISGENADYFSLLDLVNMNLIVSSFLVSIIIIYAFVVTIIAKIRGGQARFTKFVYLVSAYTAPITIGSACIVGLLTTDILLLALSVWSLPIVGGILLLYSIVLGTVAIKTVSKLSWGNALFSSSALPLLFLLTIIAPPLIRLLDSVRVR